MGKTGQSPFPKRALEFFSEFGSSKESLQNYLEQFESLKLENVLPARGW
jgi:hypothetical protein